MNAWDTVRGNEAMDALISMARTCRKMESNQRALLQELSSRNKETSDDDILTREMITGYIGAWLAQDTSDIPTKAVMHLEEAYRLCTETESH